jgi:triosephosphate isomerase
VTVARRPIIAGNWKMHLGIAESLALASEVRDRCSRFRDRDVVLAPPFTALHAVKERLGDSRILLAAQDCHWASQGAYTGEVSPSQLADVGCAYVIVGHSERRQYFGETDEWVSRKVRSLHDQGLTPIICIGETLEQREAGHTLSVVGTQLEAALAALSGDEARRSVVAYEPVWAIGTGRTATPAQAQEVHAAIRRMVAKRFDADVAEAVRIQYGGSVKPENAAELLTQPDIDGALVGGASLKADSFIRIVSFREEPV